MQDNHAAVERAAASLSLVTVNNVLRWHPCSGGGGGVGVGAGGGGMHGEHLDPCRGSVMGWVRGVGEAPRLPTRHPAAGGTLTLLPVVVAVMVLGLPGGGHV